MPERELSATGKVKSLLNGTRASEESREMFKSVFKKGGDKALKCAVLGAKVARDLEGNKTVLPRHAAVGCTVATCEEVKPHKKQKSAARIEHGKKMAKKHL
jgi:hypothetical protein